jgi:phosphoribosylformylglycinamidine synthase subunit PurQ / glutaminase
MRQFRALVLSGYGINCEHEMAKGAGLAGAEAKIVHAKEWLLGKINLLDFDFLLFPGGFAFGDELGAAKAFANRVAFSARQDDLFKFIDQGKCILGVCNGFQILVKLGILPGLERRSAEADLVRRSAKADLKTNAEASLIRNEKGMFESRWVRQKVVPSKCVFTAGIKELYLPIRHGEGNFVIPELQKLWKEGRVALQYAGPDGDAAKGYPENPNGSSDAISGICDGTGRVLGMMPHPEAALFFTQEPGWARKKEELKRRKIPLPKYGPGFQIFKNAVDYLRNR